MAKLYFRYGTMGSAKTAQLLTTAYNFKEKEILFKCIKPAIDTREGKSIIKSRIGIERECDLVSSDVNLFETYKLSSNENKHISWLLVDEAQFLTELQVEQLARLADECNINVLCYGLRTDFMTKMFPGSKRLFELADTIEEIKSICECGKKTIVNARIDCSGKIIKEGDQVEIGGNERYVAMCRRCWNDKSNVKAD